MAVVNTELSCPDLVLQCPRINRKPTLLSDHDIERIAKRRLGTTDFRVLDWALEPRDKRSGFMGQYYTLSVTVRTKEKVVTWQFFAKIPPPVHSVQYEFLVRFDSFNKEIKVYRDIFGMAGLGQGVKWCPEFFLGKENEIIVLEDTRANGYVMPDKYKTLDVDHLIWVARVLAMLHSRSLILDEKLRRQGRSLQDLYGPILREVLFVKDDEKSQMILGSSVIGTCTMIDLAETLDREGKELLKAKIKTWSEHLPRLLEPSAKYRNVACHRDIWANNMMFKHDPAGKPVGCCLVDYQFLQLCPAAYDLVFSMILTGDRATRDRHWDHLLTVYYETLAHQLSLEGLDIEHYLPRAEFLESCELARQVGLMYAMMNMQIMLLNEDAFEKYFEGSADQVETVLYGERRAQVVAHQIQAMPLYKSRMEEVAFEIRDRLPDQPPTL